MWASRGKGKEVAALEWGAGGSGKGGSDAHPP